MRGNQLHRGNIQYYSIL